MHTARNNKIDLTRLATDIKAWGRELGFQRIGIADVELGDAETRLLNWLDRERHGEMHYMESHGTRRSRPQELQPGTLRVISARMDYLPGHAADSEAVMHNPSLGFISRYALGRDYHKVMRGRLQKLAERIESKVGPFQYRAFTDSAPVLEKALAEKAGLGWIGKHTNLIDKQTGSWFFLGELYTDLPLPVDAPAENHCGTCHACLDVCPTQAIVAPYELDARRCISYLTIELRGSIPEDLRPLIGNRIYGCDDCQLVCPWNRFARPTTEPDFAPRHDLDAPELIRLFSWTEEEFMKYTEGSAIRRIGYECWLRNIAVALGNAPTSGAIVNALRIRSDYPSELVREHVRWALARHR
ncbi:MAG: tRNA epoxyqueuosine(34) reductase QueG [Candidatus Muproteobacteria bacterium RIFCSPHIGHO2_12_FULL_60_33]|uniref:Epoxyqueuosine reductase n=1 Tax=Candidatus Muproteobacteria bacterium RIFCSPLOWO2_01_FULL_60_18 TaxID=1817768 RepID=A0A1F6U071_9PROT|nr:MAG: tRNA epoxyqueuosine(34) reductase QueG [Candidatus Muproteobacteria bacterium RIFCSPHIGHO2_01_60_12]OGI50767.1 MAG: tRNA epoxyqueuosine(34) reductase QueG [Candidatus Muproteobacteria bacterium RIFCSPLOWO2_01_FULL_60_18]OGI54703.1 MAG: tRNA epoxyqueuosine(34) reductase QueG [Candidatus Muproteobacteria bacterium RIFCSPHIGHO2_12_FULL_60_33]